MTNQETGEVLSPVFTHSSDLTAFGEALAKAQAEFTAAKKDSENPHFKSKYADLQSLMDACRPILARHGIAVLQGAYAQGASVTVATRLLHQSGQWMESALTMTARDPGPQAIGSAITYARRYGLGSMAGIASEEDDDGNAAQGVSKTNGAQPVHVAAPPELTPGPQGSVHIKRVAHQPTKNKNVTKIVVELSDGRTASTIKPQLGALCEQLAQSGAPVYAETTSGRFGMDLVSVRKADDPTPEPPAAAEPSDIPLSDIPF